MRRRTFLQSTGMVATLFMMDNEVASAMDQDEQERRRAEILAEVKATAPYELLEVSGAEAQAVWKRLKRDRREVPIVVGDAESLISVFDGFSSSPDYPLPSIDKILDDASKLRFPEDLFKERAEESARASAFLNQYLSNPNAKLPKVVERDLDAIMRSDTPLDAMQQHSRELTSDEVRDMMLREDEEPPVGEWPTDKRQSPGLTVAMDWQSGRPLEKVYIALVPTKDWTEVPAYMRWGGWNECPQPEFHVAALRSWRDRYDVELVGMSHDLLNLLARRPPASREEALALAREQYAYCADNIDQGVETFSALAADLMANDWWYFWWD
ncbi:MAG: DUF4253 domain-containing protein [Hyphomicrobiales bacterium]